MLIKDLISLANEFKQVTDAVPDTVRVPSSEEISVRSGPVNKERVVEQPVNSFMETANVISTVRRYVEEHLLNDGDVLHPTRSSHIGDHFTISFEAYGNHIFDKMKKIVKSLYPTQHVRESKAYLELKYPNEETVITIALFQHDIAFKIATIQ